MGDSNPAVTAAASAAEMRDELARILEQNRQLQERVAQGCGGLRVMARVRPPTADEAAVLEAPSIHIDPHQHTISIPSLTKEGPFGFERVFGPQATQEEVFDEVKQLAESLLDGYNVTIFAYGQSGSGKTFTMDGPPSNRGVNFRLLSYILQLAQQQALSVKHEFYLSIFELYNESLRDLLDAQNRPPKNIVEENGVRSVANAVKRRVESVGEVEAAIAQGGLRRATAATALNSLSSRSHLIISLDVTSKHLHSDLVTESRLYLIDLAGSERIKESGVSGEQLAEAKAINKSLSTLGRVMQALVQKVAHVPFRESRLTMLLEPAMSGNSKTVMFVQLAPTHACASQSLNSVRFAQTARKIQTATATRRVDSLATAKLLHEKELAKARDTARAEFAAQLAQASLDHQNQIAQLKAQSSTEKSLFETELTGLRVENAGLVEKLAALVADLRRAEEALLAQQAEMDLRTKEFEQRVKELERYKAAQMAGRGQGLPGTPRLGSTGGEGHMGTPVRRRASPRASPGTGRAEEAEALHRFVQAQILASHAPLAFATPQTSLAPDTSKPMPTQEKENTAEQGPGGLCGAELPPAGVEALASPRMRKLKSILKKPTLRKRVRWVDFAAELPMGLASPSQHKSVSLVTPEESLEPEETSDAQGQRAAARAMAKGAVTVLLAPSTPNRRIVPLQTSTMKLFHHHRAPTPKKAAAVPRTAGPLAAGPARRIPAHPAAQVLGSLANRSAPSVGFGTPGRSKAAAAPKVAPIPPVFASLE